MTNAKDFTFEQEKTIQCSTEQRLQKETIIEYLRAYGYDKSLTTEEQNQFIQTALASGLNPFKREIHIALYGEGSNRKVSIITGYQNYLKRAERTGKLNGWRAWLDETGQQMKAVVEIFRKDWSQSFTHEVYWEEAVSKKKDGTPTQFWVKQPRFQLRKVAIAQAFRLAFPDELGGLPYESAELPENENNIELLPSTKTTNTQQNVKASNSGSSDSVADIPYEDETSTEENTANPESDYFSNNIRRIEDLIDEHPSDFTNKHRAWILDKAHKATDKAGIQKMLAYTEKVIRQAA